MQTSEAIITIHDWYLSPESDYPRDERKRATAAMKDLRRLSQHAWDIVCEMAESCTFTTRNYGGGQFYTWAHLPTHDGFTVELGGDPWPAARYHKAALCIQCLLRIYESEMQRRGFRDEVEA